MGFLSIPKLSLFLLSAYLGSESSAIGTTHHVAQPDRVLRAASRRSDLFRRSMRIEKSYGAELDFIDDANDWNGKRIFQSRVKVSSENPIFHIEQHEHHVEEVRCADGMMHIRFVDSVSARDAMEACSGGTVITSHESCNIEGERSVYKVTDFHHPEDDFSLKLSVVESEFSDSFTKFDISFGHTEDAHVYRKHSDFYKTRKRREEPAVAKRFSVPKLPKVSIPDVPKVSIPDVPKISVPDVPKISVPDVPKLSIPDVSVPVPEDTPEDKTLASFDLSWESIDEPFDISSFMLPVPVPVTTPYINLPLEVGCKECSTTGTLELTQGGFNIDLKQVDLVPDFIGGKDDKDIFNVITGGFVELSAKDMSAHFDLFARPRESGQFNLHLFTLPVLGFAIPGIGRAGVTPTLELSLDYEFEGPKKAIDLNYGFDLEVPSEASFKVDLSDLSKSALVGFQSAKMKPIAPTVNASDVQLLLSADLMPSFPIGFTFLKKVKAEVGIDLDLPMIDLRLSTKKAGAPQCLGSSNATGSSIMPSSGTAVSAAPSSTTTGLSRRSIGGRGMIAPFSNSTRHTNGTRGAFGKAPINLNAGDLLLVETNITIMADADATLNIPFAPAPLNKAHKSKEIFSTMFTLPATCYPYGEAMHTKGDYWASLTDKAKSQNATATPVSGIPDDTPATKTPDPILGTGIRGTGSPLKTPASGLPPKETPKYPMRNSTQPMGSGKRVSMGTRPVMTGSPVIITSAPIGTGMPGSNIPEPDSPVTDTVTVTASEPMSPGKPKHSASKHVTVTVTVPPEHVASETPESGVPEEAPATVTVTVTEEPASETPESGVPKDSPVTVTVAITPEPVTVTPEPVTVTLEPASEPMTTSSPEHVSSEPAGHGAPEPQPTEAPEPASSGPAGYGPSEPMTTDSPQPISSAPAGYGAPKPETAGSPQPASSEAAGYGAPAPASSEMPGSPVSNHATTDSPLALPSDPVAAGKPGVVPSESVTPVPAPQPAGGDGYGHQKAQCGDPGNPCTQSDSTTTVHIPDSTTTFYVPNSAPSVPSVNGISISFDGTTPATGTGAHGSSQSMPAQFTGAAVSIHIPGFSSVFAWQGLVVGVSAIAGAMVLL